MAVLTGEAARQAIARANRRARVTAANARPVVTPPKERPEDDRAERSETAP